MFKGTIYLTNDYEFAVSTLQDPRNKILDLDEFGKYFEDNDPRVIKSTCLLPPAEAVMAEIDGNRDRFIQLYYQYLTTDIVMEFITVILAAIKVENNFMIFIPEMSEDTIWVNELILFFLNTFGITIGLSETVSFMYDIRFNSRNSLLLYMNGYIDPYEFLLYFDTPFDNEMILKLINDIHPFVVDNNYINYFNELRNKIRINPTLHPAITFL